MSWPPTATRGWEAIVPNSDRVVAAAGATLLIVWWQAFVGVIAEQLQNQPAEIPAFLCCPALDANPQLIGDVAYQVELHAAESDSTARMKSSTRSDQPSMCTHCPYPTPFWYVATLMT